jgi:hypothetical protein
VICHCAKRGSYTRAVAALGLGLIERIVCRLPEGLEARIVIFGRPRGDAADANGQLVLRAFRVRNVQPCNGAHECCCRSTDPFRIGGGQADKELFATYTTDRVAGASRGLLKTGGDAAQRLISARMPVAIVESFEMIQIKAQEADGIALA